MKILIISFIFLFFQSIGQHETIKVRKFPHVKLCGLDTGVISVDTILKYPRLSITPKKSEYKIVSFAVIISDSTYLFWEDCSGDRLCNYVFQQLGRVNRKTITHFRVIDIIVLNNKKDTIKVNTIGLLLQ